MILHDIIVLKLLFVGQWLQHNKKWNSDLTTPCLYNLHNLFSLGILWNLPLSMRVCLSTNLVYTDRANAVLTLGNNWYLHYKIVVLPRWSITEWILVADERRS